LEEGKREATPVKVGLKNISKADIVRKDHLSSSEEDASFI
jgi:hypothetical protein